MRSQWMVRNKFRSTFLMIFTASNLVLFGCSVTGKTVSYEKRIPLVSDDIQKGEQVTNGVKITYTYRLYQKPSDLGGLLEIEGNAQWESGVAYKMWVWIDFLDDEGKILARKRLMGNYNVTDGRFQEKLEAPAGTASISFEASAKPDRPLSPSPIIRSDPPMHPEQPPHWP